MSNAPRHWHLLDDQPQLEEVLSLLELLEATLVAERTAVGALDPDALDAAVDDQQRIAEQLKELVASVDASIDDNGHQIVRRDDEATRELRARMHTNVSRVAALVEANAALLADAESAVSEVAGVRKDTGTYDQRAKLVKRVRAVTGKAV